MVERPQHIPEYTKRYQEVLAPLALDPRVFRFAQRDIFNFTNELLVDYEMHPDFLKDPQRVFFALAIADSLMNTPSTVEKNSLHDVLMLMATGERSGKEVTYSGKVDRLARSGDIRYQFLHPDWENKIIWDEKQGYSDEEAIAMYTDPRKTAEARVQEKQWGEGSVLHNIRTALGITPETEKPYETFVLYKTSAELNDDIEGGARCVWEKDEPAQIILPTDHKDFPDFHPHEYGHAQTREGLMQGLHGLLFRGLNEAVTDILTGNGLSYLDQKRVLVRVVIANSMNMLVAAYKGDKEAYMQFLATITNRYGVESVIALARMSASVNPEHTNALKKSVYLPVDEVLMYLW